MKQIINTDEEKCRGCARCIGVCPVSDANIISVDDGKIRIRIDAQKCVVCGACLRACPYSARYYIDDTERFFNDLKNKEPIALIVAPAFSTDCTNWKAILTWLKTQGVSVVADVSLGIDLCTWANTRNIENDHSKALITQPCPPIMGYIEKYNPELFRRVSLVYSPILCVSVYLKKTLKLPERIAALTPCPAKSREFEKANTIEYNITFAKLEGYIKVHGIAIPQADFDFDTIIAVPEGGNVISGNLLENLKRTLGCLSFNGSHIKIEMIKSCGNVYRCLDGLSGSLAGFPLLFDALNCAGGCCNGAGGIASKQKTKQDTQTNHEDSKGICIEQTRLFSVFDHTLRLADYMKPER